jgi:ABC-type multidrug transport system fused ATPase/permease subunit
VKPHRFLLVATLSLTLLGSLLAQVNAVVLDRTVIIISHSISQIIDSEMVYALQEGHIEQSGDPDELYRRGGVYKDIVDASARSLNIEKLAQTIKQ